MECDREHWGPGAHRIEPTRCAHLGEEWIALEVMDDGRGTVAFTAHTPRTTGVCFEPSERTWEAAEAALLGGYLAEYLNGLAGGQ